MGEPTGHTCHVSNTCWSGGIWTTVCDQGYCMCILGYHWDDASASCEMGYPTLLTANMTEADALSLQEMAQRNRAYTRKNVSIFAAWVTAAISCVVAGVV